jgi:hypothetical protein
MTSIADTPTNADNTVNEQVLHPGSRSLFRYWETLRAERACPTRSDVVLKDISKIVPNLFIWERELAADTFFYRLSGTAIDQLNCRTMTNLDIFEGWDSFERDVMMRVIRVAHEKLHPGIIRTRLFTNFNDAVGAETVILPILGNDGKTVQLFGGTFCFADFGKIACNHITSRQLVTARVIWTEHQNDNIPSGLMQPHVMHTPRSAGLRVIQGGRS